MRYLVERPTATQESNPDPLPAIRSFRDQLQARGIRLLVVPVPNKESVYPERLARRADGAGVVVCAQSRRLLDQLEQSGIDYVDLFEVYRLAREGERPIGCRECTWRKTATGRRRGHAAVAGAVARRVLMEESSSGVTALTTSNRSRSVALAIWYRCSRYRKSSVLSSLKSRSAGKWCGRMAEAPYRDSLESEILILGDSFLRIYEEDEPGSAGFIAHLARELGQSLGSIVNDGGASTLVRQALARNPTLLTNKKIVIWEFAERDIRFGTEGWQIVPLTRSKTTPR